MKLATNSPKIKPGPMITSLGNLKISILRNFHKFHCLLHLADLYEKEKLWRDCWCCWTESGLCLLLRFLEGEDRSATHHA